MNDDAYRRIIQLERRVQDLTERLDAIRTKNRNLAATGSRLTILQPASTIAAMTEMSGVYTVTHGDAIVFDLITRNTGTTYAMKQVTGDGPTRYVPLANISFDPLLTGEFVFGLSHNGVYVPAFSNSVRIFVAELTEAWSVGGSANCEISSMNGATLTYVEDALVFDPLGAFDVLGVGDQFYCTKQGGSYYAVNNAPCPV